MKTSFLLLVSLTLSGGVFSQPLAWDQVGSDPAYCRLFSYQSGNGVVWASATGGVAPLTFQWTNLGTGASSTNATWGGLNAGSYQITVTDNVGATLTQVIELDSLNPIANFDEIAGEVMPITNGWVGFSNEYVIFINQSENFANPSDPNADTTFFWNLNHPIDMWQISHDVYELKDTVYGAGTHQVCLVTLNKNGCADTLCKQVHIFGPATIQEGENAKFFTIYSSHHQNTLHFNCGGFDENMIVEVFSISGELVTYFETTSNQTEVSFNSSAGVYLYTVRGQKSQEIIGSGKLIH